MSQILNITRTAEAVGRNHPDKLSDQVSDLTLDYLLDKEANVPNLVRGAIETMINGNRITLGGEASLPVGSIDWSDLNPLITQVYENAGNDAREDLSILNHIRGQAGEISALTDDGGAGDQGIMIGFATTQTQSMLPLECDLAWKLIRLADELAENGTLPWLRFDTKSQVSVDGNGRIRSVIMSVQHRAAIALEDLRAEIIDKVLVPVLPDFDPDLAKINHKGSFVEGGADADCGLTGRKVVVDAYGPAIPVGGGAFSGKDPSKVDRSAAYQARQIAKTVLHSYPAGGDTCLVTLAYGIGQLQPEAIVAVIDGQHDVSDWVNKHFKDLSPSAIQERLGLWDRDGWRYSETAKFGHFGRDKFPWEKSLL